MTYHSESDSEQESIEGVLRYITFESDERDYRVWQVETGSAEVTVAGVMQPVVVGQRVRVTGRWEQTARFGKRFRASTVLVLDPDTAQGIEQYLGSGVLPGIGPALARRIVQQFGAQTLHVLDTSPQTVLRVKGLGPQKLAALIQAWRKQRALRDVMVFLQQHGLAPSLAMRVYREFGDDAIRRISDNPYCMSDHVWGVGFSTADKIARSLAIDPLSPLRLTAAMKFAMQQLQERGHVYALREQLESATEKLAKVARDTVREVLGSTMLDAFRIERLEGIGEVVYDSNLYVEECALAAKLGQLVQSAHGELGATNGADGAAGAASAENVDDAVRGFENDTGVKLAKEQREAIEMAARLPVLVITGGPGVGKTTVLRALLELYRARGWSVKLAAPTGRAAKQMTEATDHPAATIHRLLEYDPMTSRFVRCETHPIDARVVVVDEASMLDLSLALALVRAIDARTRLVLVGDVDQLPSVGPGSVLADVIASQTVARVRLTQVFRQASKSLIVTNAHRIRMGLMPHAPRKDEPRADFYVVASPDAQSVQATVLSLVCERLPKSFGFDPFTQIQVLAPTHRAVAGIDALNESLQQRLNGHGVVLGIRSFRVGDKVMQLRNDYDRDVFNGDAGVIADWRDGPDRFAVSYDGRQVVYTRGQADQLALNYACSVHKSQGSEYDAVVIALTTAGFTMLSRNLLYTAVTRGKKLVVLVAQPQAITVALRHAQQQRNTYLAQRLSMAVQPVQQHTPTTRPHDGCGR